MSSTQVNPCGNNASSLAWCCGGNNTACCGTLAEITLAPVVGVGSTISSSSTSTLNLTPTLTVTLPPASTTPSTTPPTSSPTRSSTSSGLSSGAKAGIGVVTIGALAVLSLIGFLALRRRKRRTPGNEPPANHLMQHPDRDASEVGGNELFPVAELSDGRRKGGEQQGLYEADAEYEVGRYQEAPAELADTELSPNRLNI